MNDQDGRRSPTEDRLDDAVGRSARHAVKLGVSKGVGLAVRALATPRDQIACRRSTVLHGAAPMTWRGTATGQQSGGGRADGVNAERASSDGRGPAKTRTQAAMPAPAAMPAASAPLAQPTTVRMMPAPAGEFAAPRADAGRLKVEMLSGGRAAETRLAAIGGLAIPAQRNEAPARGWAVAARMPAVAGGHGVVSPQGVGTMAGQVTESTAQPDPGRTGDRQRSVLSAAPTAPTPLPRAQIRRDGWENARRAIKPAWAVGLARSAAPTMRDADVPTQQPAYPRDDSQSQRSALPRRDTNAEGGQSANPGGDSPNGGGPTQGDVFLDGALVGRWLARDFAEAAARPANGSASFDPRRDVFPTGTMIGG